MYIYVYICIYIYIGIFVNIYTHIHILGSDVSRCKFAEASLPWKLLRTDFESYASIVQAVLCRSLLPPLLLSRTNPSPDAFRSRNPSKSTLAHDAVTAAVSHKHHSIICVGAGLIQFVYGSHSRLATEPTHHRNLFSPFFARVFFRPFCTNGSRTSMALNSSWCFCVCQRRACMRTSLCTCWGVRLKFSTHKLLSVRRMMHQVIYLSCGVQKNSNLKMFATFKKKLLDKEMHVSCLRRMEAYFGKLLTCNRKLDEYAFVLEKIDDWNAMYTYLTHFEILHKLYLVRRLVSRIHAGSQENARTGTAVTPQQL